MACPVSLLACPLARVADERRAIEKLDAVIQSTPLARASLDSLPKMAVEAGPGLAPASPSNNVVGWPKDFPSEQTESLADETLLISLEPVDALHRRDARASLVERDRIAG